MSSFYMMNRKIDNDFSSSLSNWYHLYKRDLPWRSTSDPYIIWLSEVIMQQTRVDQGYSYFIKFTECFPTVKDLAAASEDEVLKLWQGLGYYSRARNLHATAKIITDQYDGVFPSTYNDIIRLKGVGEYTAAAILSFSYNLPYAVVDGNTYRVLSRVFAVEKPIDTIEGKKIFAELADTLLDKENPGLHNQAIMELGALQCIPNGLPDCTKCPFAEICLAYARGQVSEFPKKLGKQKTRSRYFNYLDVRYEDRMYLHKRTTKDIWYNLYELPLIESETLLTLEDLQKDERFRLIFENAGSVFIQPSIRLKHVLSHQVIHASFYRIDIEKALEGATYSIIQAADVDNYAVSRLIEKYLEDKT